MSASIAGAPVRASTLRVYASNIKQVSAALAPGLHLACIRLCPPALRSQLPVWGRDGRGALDARTCTPRSAVALANFKPQALSPMHARAQAATETQQLVAHQLARLRQQLTRAAEAPEGLHKALKTLPEGPELAAARAAVALLKEWDEEDWLHMPAVPPAGTTTTTATTTRGDSPAPATSTSSRSTAASPAAAAVATLDDGAAEPLLVDDDAPLPLAAELAMAQQQQQQGQGQRQQRRLSVDEKQYLQEQVRTSSACQRSACQRSACAHHLLARDGSTRSTHMARAARGSFRLHLRTTTGPAAHPLPLHRTPHMARARIRVSCARLPERAQPGTAWPASKHARTCQTAVVWSWPKRLRADRPTDGGVAAVAPHRTP